MAETIQNFLTDYYSIAIPLSILINIVISLLGVILVFLTAINIQLFGVTNGTLISIAGEALGAIISFYIYRIGLQKFTHSKVNKYPKVERLLYVEGRGLSTRSIVSIHTFHPIKYRDFICRSRQNVITILQYCQYDRENTGFVNRSIFGLSCYERNK